MGQPRLAASPGRALRFDAVRYVYGTWRPGLAPAPGNLDDQLLLAGTVMRPIVGDDDLLDKIDRVT